MTLLLLLLRLIVSIQNLLVDWLGVSTILLLFHDLFHSRRQQLLGIELRTVWHQVAAIDHLVFRSGIRGLLILVADLRGLVSGTLSIRCQRCYILTTNAVFEVELLALDVHSELLDAAALHRYLWVLAN